MFSCIYLPLSSTGQIYSTSKGCNDIYQRTLYRYSESFLPTPETRVPSTCRPWDLFFGKPVTRALCNLCALFVGCFNLDTCSCIFILRWLKTCYNFMYHIHWPSTYHPPLPPLLPSYCLIIWKVDFVSVTVNAYSFNQEDISPVEFLLET